MPEEAVDAILAEHERAVEAVRAQYREELARRDFEDALHDALGDYRFSSQAARDAAAQAARQAELSVGEDGRLEGLQEVMDRLREADPGAFVSRPAPVRFTAAVTDGGGLTREQIISIPDRALRRAAIAENIKLFKGEN